jgi:hypothetical protein
LSHQATASDCSVYLPPPWLPGLTTTSSQKLDFLLGRNRAASTGAGTVKHQQDVGQQGSRTHDRAHLVVRLSRSPLQPSRPVGRCPLFAMLPAGAHSEQDATLVFPSPPQHTLVHGGSSPSDGVDPTLMRIVFGLSFLLWEEFGARQLADERWCESFAAAAVHCTRTAAATAPSPRSPRVCVLGLGSCVAALAAGRAGASVLWVERVTRFAEVAERVVARNGLARAVAVRRLIEWSDLRPRQSTHHDPSTADPGWSSDDPIGELGFDAVVTEEIGDGLLGDGVLAIARHAHAHVLRPGGTFVPAGARVYAALATVREEACEPNARLVPLRLHPSAPLPPQTVAPPPTNAPLTPAAYPTVPATHASPSDAD